MMHPPIPWYSRKFSEELLYLPGAPPDFDESRIALLDMPGTVPPLPPAPAAPDRLATYAPYPRQAEFHAAGSTHRERLFLAGNQLGKTLAGAAELAMFRYAPYPTGSRFRRARQRDGAFYAAEVVETAIAEAAFYQLLFFIESPEAKLPSGPGEYTAFSAACATSLHVDLTAAPFGRHRAKWTHPVEYEPCQDFADAARAAGVQIIRYESVRDPSHRANIAVLSCAAFADTAPRARQTWHIFTRRHAVQARCESPQGAIEFRREDFAGDPRIQ